MGLLRAITMLGFRGEHELCCFDIPILASEVPPRERSWASTSPPARSGLDQAALAAPSPPALGAGKARAGRQRRSALDFQASGRRPTVAPHSGCY